MPHRQTGTAASRHSAKSNTGTTSPALTSARLRRNQPSAERHHPSPTLAQGSPFAAASNRADSAHSTSSASAARRALRVDSAHSTSSGRAIARGPKADQDEFDLHGFEEIGGAGDAIPALPEPMVASPYPQVACYKINIVPTTLCTVDGTH